ECPQQIVPAFVRAVRFDDSDLCGGKPLFAFEPVFWFEPEDRKMSISARRYAVASSQGCGEKVKRTSERANDRACLGIDNGRQRLFCARYQNELVGMRIGISDNFLHVVSPRSSPGGEDWELGLAPI